MYLIIENNVSNAFDRDTIVRKIYIWKWKVLVVDSILEYPLVYRNTQMTRCKVFQEGGHYVVIVQN